MRIVAEVIATRAAVKDKIWGEQLDHIDVPSSDCMEEIRPTDSSPFF